jgi:hypothetical protein
MVNQLKKEQRPQNSTINIPNALESSTPRSFQNFQNNMHQSNSEGGDSVVFLDTWPANSCCDLLSASSSGRLEVVPSSSLNGLISSTSTGTCPNLESIWVLELLDNFER